MWFSFSSKFNSLLILIDFVSCNSEASQENKTAVQQCRFMQTPVGHFEV